MKSIAYAVLGIGLLYVAFFAPKKGNISLTPIGSLFCFALAVAYIIFASFS